MFKKIFHFLSLIALRSSEKEIFTNSGESYPPVPVPKIMYDINRFGENKFDRSYHCDKNKKNCDNAVLREEPLETEDDRLRVEM
jgi:hypothetical protein